MILYLNNLEENKPNKQMSQNSKKLFYIISSSSILFFLSFIILMNTRYNYWDNYWEEAKIEEASNQDTNKASNQDAHKVSNQDEIEDEYDILLKKLLAEEEEEEVQVDKVSKEDEDSQNGFLLGRVYSLEKDDYFDDYYICYDELFIIIAISFIIPLIILAFLTKKRFIIPNSIFFFLASLISYIISYIICHEIFDISRRVHTLDIFIIIISLYAMLIPILYYRWTIKKIFYFYYKTKHLILLFYYKIKQLYYKIKELQEDVKNKHDSSK